MTVIFHLVTKPKRQFRCTSWAPPRIRKKQDWSLCSKLKFSTIKS